MASEQIVVEVNSELQRLHAEAVAQRDNPRLTRVIELLVALTHDDEEKAAAAVGADRGEDDAQESPEGESKSAGPVAVAKPGPCKHPALNAWGKCQACGECQHTNVRGGYCLTCDKEMSAQAT